MKFFNWITGRFSKRGKALSLYNRGTAKANRQDHRGAIDDYTTVISMPNAAADVIAIVLFNRALAYAATGDNSRSIDDLDAVLAMDEIAAVVNAKTLARQMLARMASRSRKTDV